MMQEELLKTFIEIKLKDPADFLKIKETLTRIGIASRDNVLYQSCHILHKQGKYYILHFKELFALDGKVTNFSEEDRARRNRIATLLEDWKLLEILVPDSMLEPKASMNHIKVIPYKEKTEWVLEPKYNVGNKSKPM